MASTSKAPGNWPAPSRRGVIPIHSPTSSPSTGHPPPTSEEATKEVTPPSRQVAATADEPSLGPTANGDSPRTAPRPHPVDRADEVSAQELSVVVVPHTAGGAPGSGPSNPSPSAACSHGPLP